MKNTATNKNSGSSIARPPKENLAPINKNIHGRGLCLFPPPPPLYNSCPPSIWVFNQHMELSQQKPPLLPLPISSRPYKSLPTTPSARKPYRPRDGSLSTPKKSSKQQPRRSEKPNFNATQPLGPDPTHLPKHVPKVFSPPTSSSVAGNSGFAAVKDLDSFPDSVFKLSPPPSSLPFPRFFIRSKLMISCTAEAAEVDPAATDDLRRLLRLP